MISSETRELADAIKKATAEDRRANTFWLICWGAGMSAAIVGATLGFVGPFAPYYPAVALMAAIAWLLLTAMVLAIGKGWKAGDLGLVAVAIVVGFYLGEASAESLVTMFSNYPLPSGTYIPPLGGLPAIP